MESKRKFPSGSQFRDEYIHDFMSDRPYLLLVSGYKHSTSRMYRAYVGCIFVYTLFVMTASIEVMFVSDKKELMMDAIHTFLLAFFTFLNLINRLIGTEGLLKAREIILSGFYRYKGEELDDESHRILATAPVRVHKAVRLYNQLAAIATASNLLVFIGVQAILATEEEYEAMADTCDIYLPHCLILPFSTRSRLGWFMGYLVNCAIVFYTYGVATACIEVYVSTTIQYTVQTAFLNHSISRVFERADQLFLKTRGGPSVSFARPVHLPEYQHCLYRCLRANIQHQQLLKSFQDSFKNCTGGMLLIIIFVSAFGFGSRLCLLMQIDNIGKLLNYTMVLLTEQCYGLYLCFFGQVVLDESSRQFEALYSIPWYLANKSFTKVLYIMMLRTREPYRVKAIFFDLVASMETYGDIVAAVYKVSNLFRQSDNIQH